MNSQIPIQPRAISAARLKQAAGTADILSMSQPRDDPPKPMTQRLSIKHLQVLAAFRRTGRLSKIAEFLKLTPSAVSRRIDEAEAERTYQALRDLDQLTELESPVVEEMEPGRYRQ